MVGGKLGGVVGMPKAAVPQSLTSLREKLIKIVTRSLAMHGRYLSLQIPVLAVSRRTFAGILSLIAWLQAAPAPT
jgi:hypothetical protein